MDAVCLDTAWSEITSIPLTQLNWSGFPARIEVVRSSLTNDYA